ncbi:MAG: TonB C-terminal domain-containing protein [Opitutales bacterium]
MFKLLPSPAHAVAPVPTRTVVQPKPAPSPPPVPVAPKPKPPKPKVEKPKAQPPPVIKKRKIIKKPEPALEKTTLGKWRKDHPNTKPTSKPTTSSKRVKVTPLDVDSFKVKIDAPKIPPRPGLTAEEIDEQDLYLAQAGVIIERQWMHLKSGAKLRGPTNATMEFRIMGNGSLWSLRLTETSAFPEFNRLIHLAFRSVGNLGPPPSAINYPLTMTFRLN